MKTEITEKAYIIVGDLVNVHRAQDALRGICQPNSVDYISQEDYQKVMGILAKWSDEMFERIECVSETKQSAKQTDEPFAWYSEEKHGVSFIQYDTYSVPLFRR